MKRQCSLCKSIYGCYNPEKRSCGQCQPQWCPSTDKVTHGICPSCWEVEVKKWQAYCGAYKG